MRSFIVFILLAAPAFAACDSKVRSTTGNFPAELSGPVDTRPGTWGTAEATTRVITFNPPKGCRVEILKLRGDMVAWPMGAVEPGKQAGVLVGMGKVPEGTKAVNPNLQPQPQTPAPAPAKPKTGHAEETGPPADWSDESTILYLQGGTDGPPTRIPFSEDIVDGLLNSNNQLLFKMASWLNTTGRSIHTEVTWTAHFRWVDAP